MKKLVVQKVLVVLDQLYQEFIFVVCREKVLLLLDILEGAVHPQLPHLQILTEEQFEGLNLLFLHPPPLQQLPHLFHMFPKLFQNVQRMELCHFLLWEVEVSFKLKNIFFNIFIVPQQCTADRYDECPEEFECEMGTDEQFVNF